MGNGAVSKIQIQKFIIKPLNLLLRGGFEVPFIACPDESGGFRGLSCYFTLKI
jgi:hypothetical protein